MSDDLIVALASLIFALGVLGLNLYLAYRIWKGQ